MDERAKRDGNRRMSKVQGRIQRGIDQRMKKFWILPCLFLIVGIGMYLIFNTPEVEIEEIGNNESFEGENTIMELAKNVSESYEFELHKFDCTDFSEELVKRLKEKGFNAYCVFGRWEIPDYKLHTWVEIDMLNYFIEIEATKGRIISNEDFKEYAIKSKGKCI